MRVPVLTEDRKMGKDVAGFLLGADFSAHSPWKVQWRVSHGGSCGKECGFLYFACQQCLPQIVSLQSIPFSSLIAALEVAGLCKGLPR